MQKKSVLTMHFGGEFDVQLLGSHLVVSNMYTVLE
jgi:hypothetical protein